MDSSGSEVRAAYLVKDSQTFAKDKHISETPSPRKIEHYMMELVD